MAYHQTMLTAAIARSIAKPIADSQLAHLRANLVYKLDCLIKAAAENGKFELILDKDFPDQEIVQDFGRLGCREHYREMKFVVNVYEDERQSTCHKISWN